MSRSEHLSGERIQDWLDGRLGPSAAARIEVHLEDCSRCGAEVEGWRALLGELSQLGPLAPRPGFRGRVLDEVARAALAQLPLAARVRGSLDHWMRRLRVFGAGHPQPARLQQFAEGALAHLPAAAVRRHLARCASCRTEARRWTALIRALGELPRLAPSPDFAPAVLRAVRLAPAPAASRARRLLGRARTLVALSPRRAWAAAWGFALTPAVTAGLIAYAIFSHPLVTVGNLAAFLSGSERERLRRELRDELRQDLGRGRAIEQDIERDDAGGSALLRPVRRLGAAVGGVIELLIATLLIAGLGGGIALHFAREELEVVGEAARRNPVQAGMVGLAGSFLIVPAYVLGMIALVITVVGILAVPFWIALFPAVVALAIALGYLAVALGVGEWVARQRVPKLEWVRLGNPYSTMIAGVGALMLAFLGARVLGAFGLLDILSGLLLVVGVLGTVAAALIGFGAVLMTRGGRRPAYGSAAGYWGEENWDDDLGMGPPPPASPPPPPPPPPQGADAGPTGGEDTTA